MIDGLKVNTVHLKVIVRLVVGFNRVKKIRQRMDGFCWFNRATQGRVKLVRNGLQWAPFCGAPSPQKRTLRAVSSINNL